MKFGITTEDTDYEDTDYENYKDQYIKKLEDEIIELKDGILKFHKELELNRIWKYRIEGQIDLLCKQNSLPALAQKTDCDEHIHVANDVPLEENQVKSSNLKSAFIFGLDKPEAAFNFKHPDENKVNFPQNIEYNPIAVFNRPLHRAASRRYKFMTLKNAPSNDKVTTELTTTTNCTKDKHDAVKQNICEDKQKTTNVTTAVKPSQNIFAVSRKLEKITCTNSCQTEQTINENEVELNIKVNVKVPRNNNRDNVTDSIPINIPKIIIKHSTEGIFEVTVPEHEDNIVNHIEITPKNSKGDMPINIICDVTAINNNGKEIEGNIFGVKDTHSAGRDYKINAACCSGWLSRDENMHNKKFPGDKKWRRKVKTDIKDINRKLADLKNEMKLTNIWKNDINCKIHELNKFCTYNHKHDFDKLLRKIDQIHLNIHESWMEIKQSQMSRSELIYRLNEINDNIVKDNNVSPFLMTEMNNKISLNHIVRDINDKWEKLQPILKSLDNSLNNCSLDSESLSLENDRVPKEINEQKLCKDSQLNDNKHCSTSSTEIDASDVQQDALEHANAENPPVETTHQCQTQDTEQTNDSKNIVPSIPGNVPNDDAEKDPEGTRDEQIHEQKELQPKEFDKPCDPIVKNSKNIENSLVLNKSVASKISKCSFSSTISSLRSIKPVQYEPVLACSLVHPCYFGYTCKVHQSEQTYKNISIQVTNRLCELSGQIHSNTEGNVTSPSHSGDSVDESTFEIL